MSTYIAMPVGERQRGQTTVSGPAYDIPLDYIGFIVTHPALGERYVARVDEPVPDDLARRPDVFAVSATKAAAFLSARGGEAWTAGRVASAFQLRS